MRLQIRYIGSVHCNSHKPDPRKVPVVFNQRRASVQQTLRALHVLTTLRKEQYSQAEIDYLFTS